MRFISAVVVAFVAASCASQPLDAVDSGVDEACCCASIVEGDIVEESPADSADACASREQGSCVDAATVAARVTPHACCPEATGERCGD